MKVATKSLAIFGVISPVTKKRAEMDAELIVAMIHEDVMELASLRIGVNRTFEFCVRAIHGSAQIVEMPIEPKHTV